MLRRKYLALIALAWATGVSTASAQTLVWSDDFNGDLIGLYVNESSATWDLVNFVIVSGTGVVTTVTGEQVFWVITPDQPGIQFTGGTGRFENATGSFTTVSMSEPIITVDTLAGTMTMTVSYVGVGTITY